MGEWLRHDGKGVPPDAKQGVTQIILEDSIGEKFPFVWTGWPEQWDWSFYGKPCSYNRGVVWSRIIAYRNPSTDAAVEALKALAAASGADNPKRKVKEAT